MAPLRILFSFCVLISMCNFGVKVACYSFNGVGETSPTFNFRNKFHDDFPFYNN